MISGNEYEPEELKEMKDECYFYDKIEEFEGMSLYERVYGSSHSFVVQLHGAYEFASDPACVQFVLYQEISKDICNRWKKRLDEKVLDISSILKSHFSNFDIECDVDSGDGDECCVYPSVFITIPLKEFGL